MPTLDEFFAGQASSRRLFKAVDDAIQSIGPAQIHVSKSQVAFWRRKAFVWVWRPEQYLRRKAAPLVLTFSFRQPDPSPRWKQIVEATPGRFTHHLELYSAADIDTEVRAWLQAAWESAG